MWGVNVVISDSVGYENAIYSQSVKSQSVCRSRFISRHKLNRLRPRKNPPGPPPRQVGLQAQAGGVNQAPFVPPLIPPQAGGE